MRIKCTYLALICEHLVTSVVRIISNMLISFHYLFKVLEDIKVTKKMDRDTLINVARTSLRTKLHSELADLLTEVRRIIKVGTMTKM